MKISRNWLQTFFEKDLPPVERIDEALTFHALEIDGVATTEHDEVIDVKITANRAHDCMSHRGIAKELSAILEFPMKHDPLAAVPLTPAPVTNDVALSIEKKANPLHVLCLVKGVTVGPSPEWLVQQLEAVGQRSINNVVDATNYIMLSLGQPTHVFDWDKLTEKDGTRGITTRFSKKDEPITLLGGLDKVLPEGVLVLADAHTDTPLDIAAIKGGKHAELTDTTKNVLITAAAFDPILIRKTSQKLKLRTDASHRFENNPPHVLPLVAAPEVAALIVSLAGGSIAGYAVEGNTETSSRSVSVSLSHLNGLLGAQHSEASVAHAFDRLGFEYVLENGVFVVSVPFMRSDITIAEDLIEEAGRIIGYDTVQPTRLRDEQVTPVRDRRYEIMDAVREVLLQKGLTEVHTSVFDTKGDRGVLNKVESDTPFLRTALSAHLTKALEKNILVKDVVESLRVVLFEVGTVWKEGKELIAVAVAAEKQKKQPTAAQILNEALAALGITLVVTGDVVAEVMLDEDTSLHDVPTARSISEATVYKHFSKYPYISRDIALWCPATVTPEEVQQVLVAHAGALLVTHFMFDRFEKEGKVSYAFRLVFQSFDRTLMDEDVLPRMESIYGAVKAKGWEVR